MRAPAFARSEDIAPDPSPRGCTALSAFLRSTARQEGTWTGWDDAIAAAPPTSRREGWLDQTIRRWGIVDEPASPPAGVVPESEPGTDR